MPPFKQSPQSSDVTSIDAIAKPEVQHDAGNSVLDTYFFNYRSEIERLNASETAIGDRWDSSLESTGLTYDSFVEEEKAKLAEERARINRKEEDRINHLLNNKNLQEVEQQTKIKVLIKEINEYLLSGRLLSGQDFMEVLSSFDSSVVLDEFSKYSQGLLSVNNLKEGPNSSSVRGTNQYYFLDNVIDYIRNVEVLGFAKYGNPSQFRDTANLAGSYTPEEKQKLFDLYALLSQIKEVMINRILRKKNEFVEVEGDVRFVFPQNLPQTVESIPAKS